MKHTIDVRTIDQNGWPNDQCKNEPRLKQQRTINKNVRIQQKKNSPSEASDEEQICFIFIPASTQIPHHLPLKFELFFDGKKGKKKYCFCSHRRKRFVMHRMGNFYADDLNALSTFADFPLYDVNSNAHTSAHSQRQIDSSVNLLDCLPETLAWTRAFSHTQLFAVSFDCCKSTENHRHQFWLNLNEFYCLQKLFCRLMNV